MIKWVIAFAFIGLVVVGGSYMVWQNTQQQTQPRAVQSYPDSIYFVPPNLCVGTYYNGVSVSWPTVNGKC